MRKMLAVSILSAAISALVSTSLAKANGREFLQIKNAVHNHVAILGKNPDTLPVPLLPKDWKLMQVISEDASTYHYSLWFQDEAGNVYRMESRLKDESMGVSPKVFRIPALF